MENDIWSEISRKFTGLDITFFVLGSFWAGSTIMAIPQMGLTDLLAAILIWGGFAGCFYGVRRMKIKSNSTSVICLILVLHVWKTAVAFLIL